MTRRTIVSHAVLAAGVIAGFAPPRAIAAAQEPTDLKRVSLELNDSLQRLAVRYVHTRG